MDARLYARARAVFFAALDLPPAARRAFVAEECGADASLRAEVDLLLDALEEGGALDSIGPGQDLRSAAEDAFRAPADDASPGLPRRIGKHDVIGCLGEGGMGVVYEAEQRQPRRRVAIKVLRPALVTPEFVESFRREAELLGRLRHPGIASVFEAGQARPWGRTGPELPYLVMELVDGLPITAYAAKARLSVEAKLELLARTCDAVQHAHDRGVVHRDLKPANVLVDETGQPRVLDFGVARALDTEPAGRAAQGEAAHVVGTLSYMSPEQVSDKGARSGTSSDVYALGVLLYELLASRLPLQLVGLPLGEALRRIREDDPPALGTIDRRLSGDVESIAAKALEKDPARRYSSPAHIAADIRRHLANEPILARPQRATYRARKFARRHRGLVLSALTIMLVLAAAGITGSVLALRATRSQKRAEAASAEASAANYRAQLGAAVGALREGDALTAAAHLDAAPEASREWTWRHLRAALDDSLSSVRAEVRDHPTLTPAPGGFVVRGGDGVSVVYLEGALLKLASHRAGNFPGASPDGTRVLEARDDRWLLHDTGDLARRPVDLGGPTGRAAAALADGTWIVDSGGRLVALSPDGTSRRDLGVSSRGPIEATPDGRAVVAVTEDAVVSCRAGSLDAPARLLPLRATALAFDAAGSLLLAGDELGRMHCVPLTSGPAKAWSDTATGRHRIAFIRVDPRGRHFLSVDRSGRAVTRSLADGSPVGLATTTGYNSARGFYSPDGEIVVLPRTNGSIAATTPEGRWAALPRVGHGAAVESIAWSSGWMVSVDRAGLVRTFVSPGTSERRRLAGHETYVYSAQFGAGGRSIISTGWDGSVRTWDGITGALLESWRPGGVIGRVVRMPSPDRLIVAIEGDLVLRDLGTGAELARRAGDVVDLDAAAGRVIALDADGTIAAWSADLAVSQRRLPSIGGATSDSRRACLNADGSRVAVSAGSVLKELDVASGRELWTAGSMQGDVLGLSRQAGGRLIAGACREGGVTLWDAGTGAMVRELDVPGGATLAVAFHPTEHVLATGSLDGSVQTWDLRSGERIARLPAHDDYVKSLAFSDDGTMLVTASGDTTLQLFDTVRLSERYRASRPR